MIRTTLVLDAALYAELRKRAAAEGRTLTDVVERALRAGLSARSPARRPRLTLPSYDLGPFLVTPGDAGHAAHSRRTGSAGEEDWMVAVDSSLLAYAVNRYAPEHARAADVLEQLVNGETPWAIAWPTVHAFIGLVTHRHAVARPLGLPDAWAFVEGLLASPSVRALGPTERHAAVLGEIVPGLPPGPGSLAGLETAAVLREHGVRELLGTDRGMRRFGFLSVRDPLHGERWTVGAPPMRRYRVLKTRSRAV